MKLYWRIRSLPELDHLTNEQRSHLLKNNAKRTTLWAAIYALIAGISATSVFGNSTSWPVAMPIGVVTAVALYQYHMRSLRIDLQRQIIEAYRGKQLPICLKCGYDLRGTEAVACPECGAGVHVKLKS